MKITFTQKSIKAINKWLKHNGFAVECALTNGDSPAFVTDVDDNKYILMPKHYDSEPDGLFMKCLRNLGLDTDFDAVTLSVLHELGHAQTFDLFTLKEWNRCADIKNDLEENDDTEGNEIYFKYWRVKDEFAANSWVVLYTKCFPKKVQRLEDTITDTIKIG